MATEKPTLERLDSQLGEVLHRVRRMRELDLSTEQERDQALEESRCILGAIARYRHWLEEIERTEAPHRQAA